MTELSLQINRGLIEGAEQCFLCPAFIACYHEKFGTLCYTNAGHTPALLKDGSGVTELASTGLPLGLFSHATAEARIVALETGRHRFCLSPRAWLHAKAATAFLDEFGLDRVKSLLQDAPAMGARALCDAVLKGVADFSEGSPVCDDRTVLALIRTA